MPVDSSKQPYDIAIDYCRDKGEIAQYTSNGETERFIYSNGISNIIAIHR